MRGAGTCKPSIYLHFVACSPESPAGFVSFPHASHTSQPLRRVSHIMSKAVYESDTAALEAAGKKQVLKVRKYTNRIRDLADDG